VFNMGVGFVLVVDKETCDFVLHYLNKHSIEASIIGEVNDKGTVRIKGVDF